LRIDRGLVGWFLYDWANSAFPTVITTFVFATYYVKALAVDAAAGTADWAMMAALNGIVVAIVSPPLGAIADQTGRRKPWILGLTLLCGLSSCLLWWAEPGSWAVLALVIVAVATLGNELGAVFYNAMLPDLVGRAQYGRASGYGWGIGYAGGLVCLGLALILVQSDPPLLGLDASQAEPVRLTAPLVGLWTILFALPLLLWTPDKPDQGISMTLAVRNGLRTLWATLSHLRRYRAIMRFMLARLFYTDGLNTLFAFGGIYAAGTFGMDFGEIIAFGIALNVTAGLGASAFGWVDDRIGAKPTILIALAGLILCGGALLVITDKAWFWALGLALGIFIGPAQSASRSLMAHLAPADMRTEMFGLFALSGKVTAFLGPTLLGIVTAATQSQRAGMATIVALLAIGAILLAFVREDG
jgi:UMF1 family MFS transporter